MNGGYMANSIALDFFIVIITIPESTSYSFAPVSDVPAMPEETLSKIGRQFRSNSI
jgi:hypothetical protein